MALHGVVILVCPSPCPDPALSRLCPAPNPARCPGQTLSRHKPVLSLLLLSSPVQVFHRPHLGEAAVLLLPIWDLLGVRSDR